jgi:hypothetical protein
MAKIALKFKIIKHLFYKRRFLMGNWEKRPKNESSN